MINLMNFTWKEIEQIDKEKSIVFITIAPIEEHSLCLPIGTDIYEGEDWIVRTADKLKVINTQYECYKLPPFPIASASAMGFYGCIHFKAKTTYMTALELLSNIASWNFKNIIIIASHGDPIHQIAMEKACKQVNRKYGVCAFSPMGAFFSAEELGIDLNMPEKVLKLKKDSSDDFHAGWIETSCMLDIEELLVHKEFRKLPATHIKEQEMISAKRQLEVMGQYGHLGSPALAEKEIGKLMNDNTADYLARAVEAFINREDYQKYMHHSLYKLPFMHLKFL